MGQPLATVLRADNAPVQGTDRFVLEASNACLVDDVNIGDGVSEYVYDALGRRIEKRSGGGATRYLHDGARVAEEWDVPAAGSPALAASYVYGNYIDEVLTMRRGGADYYYHADDQHNVVKLTDGAGAVVEAYPPAADLRHMPTTACRNSSTRRATSLPARPTATPTSSPAANGTRNWAITTTATATSTPPTGDSPAAIPSASGATR